MAAKHILHMLSPLKHVSPFDANMAVDAGFDAVLTYGDVTQGEVTTLVQDAMFSRSPGDAVRTGVFFAGKDALAALDMIETAKTAMFPPFVMSVFADPAGSFTTAAAMVACVERVLRKSCGRNGLRGLRVAIFGATGVVGFASAVIAAGEGAQVTMVGHDGISRVARSATEIARRFGASADPADGSDDQRKSGILADADVALCAGRAGVRILSAHQIAASRLLVAADVNAVPPPGVEGLDIMANGTPIGASKTLGVGAIAIGQIKYRTEFGLFRRMIETTTPVSLDFRDAFALARDLVAG